MIMNMKVNNDWIAIAADNKYNVENGTILWM